MAGNLYRKPGGRIWYARLQVRGREYRRSLFTANLTEARVRLKAELARAEQIRFSGEPRHAWPEAVVGWAQDAAQSLKPATLKRYLVSLRQVRGIMDGLYVDEITQQTVSRIGRRAGRSNATRRRDLSAVSTVLRWCRAAGWREDNPARSWDRSLIVERRSPIVLPRGEDIARVVASAPSNFGAMIRLAQYTGMRQEEVASLTRAQLRPGAVQIIQTKTGRPRSVPLDERAAGTIVGTPARVGCPYVFWSERGDRYHEVASRFRVIVKRSGAAPFRFHDLRHWFAIDYLRRGGSIYTLQQILGHASIKTTEIYLAYLTPEEAGKSKRTG